MPVVSSNLIYLAVLAAAVPALAILRRHRRLVMLLTSYGFYAVVGGPFLALVIGVAAFAHFVGRSAASLEPRHRRQRAYAGAAFLLFVFVVTRTTASARIVTTTSHWLGDGLAGSLASGVVPLGVSFYMLEAIGYLLDVARGRDGAYAFWDMQLYLAFFPSSLAGPIMRAKELIRQFQASNSLGSRARRAPWTHAVTTILWGLFLKMAIADTLNHRLEHFFDHSIPLAPLDTVVIGLGVGLQVYLDFLGYSMMAGGAAILCGVDLVKNFNHPFHARSVSEFWNRWHMSLSRWIRDYVFLAAVGSGRSLKRLSIAALLAMAISGVWHRLTLGFLLWGTFHGVLLALSNVYRVLLGARIAKRIASRRTLTALYGLAAWLLTTCLLLPAWILFRAPTVQRAAGILSGFVAFGRPEVVDATTSIEVVEVFVLVLAAPLAQRAVRELIAWEERAGSPGGWSVAALRGGLLGVLFAIVLMYWGFNDPFVYQQF